MNLPKIIKVDEDKCINCHQCIAVCSTKFANNGSGDHVEIIDDLCIGCGECIKACSHDARIPMDDFEAAFNSIAVKEKIVAVIAPAIAANFPDHFLHFNGWLKSIGISAVFDVSFGAELTVKSYVNHIEKNNPKSVISQPCPAIVTYIEVYRPELIPYLAPADSPMMHTVKMVKNYYEQYKDHKVLVVSPCLAKKREFDAVGLVDFNVTMKSFEKYLEEEKIELKNFPKVEFDNDPAERAVLFSTPGGLLSTAERDVQGIRSLTRKIEGPHTIYNYLDHLPEQIKLDRVPLLIDCLNCENGCNGGTGTTKQEVSPDELEYFVEKRRSEMQNKHKTEKESKESIEKLHSIIDEYWDAPLYERSYTDRSKLFTSYVKMPSEVEIKNIYHKMHKYKEEDILNCATCGYNSCEMMAQAIHNGLNKVENCHFYLQYENDQNSEELENTYNQLVSQKNELIDQSNNLLKFIEKIRNIAK